jgi:membrane-associated phospholipid phosphatase
MPASILDWGIDLILWLQSSVPDWALGPLNFFTFLGYEEWFLLMMPFVFWCIDSKIGVRLGIYLTTAGILTAMLKVYMHDPRPYWYDASVQLLTEAETSFGIPSGHAMIGLTVWGGLAASLRKRWAWIAAGFIIFMIGLSRLVLGVHFPTDVIFGWIIGAILLFLLVRFEDGIAAFYNRFSFTGKLFLLLIPGIALIITGTVLNNLVEPGVIIPQAWIDTVAATGTEAIHPFDYTVYTTNVAVFFGAVIGYTWLLMNGGFDAGGAWGKRLLRYVVGLLVVVAIWAGLDAAFSAIAEDTSLLGIVLRFIRYGLMGLWIGGFGPATFKRLGWANRVTE